MYIDVGLRLRRSGWGIYLVFSCMFSIAASRHPCLPWSSDNHGSATKTPVLASRDVSLSPYIVRELSSALLDRPP